MKSLMYRKPIKSNLNPRIRLLLGTNAVVMLAAAMLGPLYALFVADIGGDILDAGLSYSIYAVVSGLVMIISGRFSDKLRREKWVMIFGYLILALAFFSYTFVYSVTTLLFVQILLGFGIAIYYPAYDSLYSQNLDKNNFALEWGIDEAKNFFADAIGASVGGFIAYKFGFDSLFVIMGSITLISMLYAMFYFKQ